VGQVNPTTREALTTAGRFAAEHHSILVTGMTGTGKTYVACALAHQACRQGHRALYRRASRLFHELRLARADGTYQRLLARFARVNVLVIDDFDLAPLDDHDKQDLLEVLEDRYATGSTIVTSQLAPDNWHEHLGEPTVADAICDRLLNHAHRLALKGPSRRKENTPNRLERLTPPPSVASLRFGNDHDGRNGRSR